MVGIITIIFIVIALAVALFSGISRKNKESGTVGERFSMRSIIKKLLSALKRFPITILLVIGLAVLFFIAINNDFDDVQFRFWIFFSIGAFISIATTLISEDHFKNLVNYGITLLAVLFWGVYCLFLPESSNDVQISKGIEIFVLGAAAFSAMLFISYLSKNKDRPFWNFAIQMLFQMVLAGAFGAILLGGLSLALLALDVLFNISIDWEVYANLAVICLVLFSPIYFMTNIPDGAEKHDNEIVYSKIGKILALYIITPILAIYAAILYVYLFKIIVIWELPNGWVAWLVSALALGGLVVITLLYPIREQEKSKAVDFISRWFGLLILPLLILMTVGIFRRLADYGITINRYYILALNIWFYGIFAYLLLTHSRHIKWILISFVTVAILTSTGAYSAANVTKRSLTKEICTVLDKPVTFEEAKMIFAGMIPEEKNRMKSTIKYLHEYFGEKSLQPYFIDTVPRFWSDFSSIADLRREFNKSSEWISFRANREKTHSIDGYAYFKYVTYYHCDSTASTDGAQITLELTEENRTFLIPGKDIFQKYQDSTEKSEGKNDYLTIKGDNYTLLIFSFNGFHDHLKDSVSINSFSGYLFYK